MSPTTAPSPRRFLAGRPLFGPALLGVLALVMASVVGIGAAAASTRPRVATPKTGFVPVPPVSTTTTSTTTTVPGATTTTTTLPGTVHPTTTEQKLVVGYSSALLGRAPTAAELTSGVTTIDLHGVDAYVAGLLGSTTYRTAWVGRQFQRYLGRSAGTGAGYYVSWLAAGRSYDQVVASLVSSTEFVTKHPSVTCAGSGACANAWVAPAYAALTGTTIPASVRAGYQARLSAGASRYQVAAAIITSGTGRSAYVGQLFQQWLHRAPTPFERFVYVTTLLQGTSAAAVEADVLELVEFSGQFVSPNS